MLVDVYKLNNMQHYMLTLKNAAYFKVSKWMTEY